MYIQKHGLILKRLSQIISKEYFRKKTLGLINFFLITLPKLKSSTGPVGL